MYCGSPPRPLSGSIFLRNCATSTRRYSGWSIPATPHTARSRVLWVSTRSALRAKYTIRSNSFGVRCTSTSRTITWCRSRSMRKSPSLIGLCSGSSIEASRRACTRTRASAPPPALPAPPPQQLLDAERLGDVVVRAFIEGRHLLRVLVAHAEHDHRHLRPRADLPGQLDAVHAGHGQIGNHQLRFGLHKLRQRVCAVLRHHHLVPIALQRRAQHPRNLRLVIHNQYPHGPPCLFLTTNNQQLTTVLLLRLLRHNVHIHVRSFRHKLPQRTIIQVLPPALDRRPAEDDLGDAVLGDVLRGGHRDA